MQVVLLVQGPASCCCMKARAACAAPIKRRYIVTHCRSAPHHEARLAHTTISNQQHLQHTMDVAAAVADQLFLSSG
jgi:hypothetical protein